MWEIVRSRPNWWIPEQVTIRIYGLITISLLSKLIRIGKFNNFKSKNCRNVWNIIMSNFEGIYLQIKTFIYWYIPKNENPFVSICTYHGNEEVVYNTTSAECTCTFFCNNQSPCHQTLLKRDHIWLGLCYQLLTSQSSIPNSIKVAGRRAHYQTLTIKLLVPH